MSTRSTPFFSLVGPALEETDHFGQPEDRAREAENIRLEYLESKKTARLPGVAESTSSQSSDFPDPGIEPGTDPYSILLKNALEEVDFVDLKLLLNLVLTELRTRESDQMKEDILTHSKKLRLDAACDEWAHLLGKHF